MSDWYKKLKEKIEEENIRVHIIENPSLYGNRVDADEDELPMSVRTESEFLEFGIVFDAQYNPTTALIDLHGHPVVKYAYGQSIFELAEAAQGTDVAEIAARLRPFATSLQSEGRRMMFGSGAPSHPQVDRLPISQAIVVSITLERGLRTAQVEPPWVYRLQDAHWRLEKSVATVLSIEPSLLSDWRQLLHEPIATSLHLAALHAFGPLGDFGQPDSNPAAMMEDARAAIAHLRGQPR
jgi:hypothetical protein